MVDNTSIYFDTPRGANVLLCAPGRRFEPNDLANLFDQGVIVGAVGTITVTHWALADAKRQIKESFFDQLSASDNVGVVVFHEDVDPTTRLCSVCGKQIGLRP